MPGVIMDNANVEGSVRGPGLNDATNGALHSLGTNEKFGPQSTSMNGPVHVNGIGGGGEALNQHVKASTQEIGELVSAPFEIPHITQGFFPFGTLVHRAVQNCWNELSDLISELATIQVPSEPSAASAINGKSPGNQSAENIHKKMRILEFAHARRAEFIKLLVLSQWSRQAAEVSRLIDIQGFIRTRHQAYTNAIHYVGVMKQDLVRAQVANPDLKTALEVLAKGRVTSLPDFGYKPPRPLSARATLKKLHKINRIISARLILQDQVPHPLRHYRVHDGRVTFTVAGEFELDLSVAEEAKTSQFFFVDIRFLFTPSSPIPKGRILNELDGEINRILLNDGLFGCFNFLHGLVLTNKVNTLYKQAIQLARGLWSDALRIELLHRTLVVQYWPSRAGPKSWIEIGVRRGAGDSNNKVPQLNLRWMRNGQHADSDAVNFDSDVLSIERILRSVIALHTSHVLSSAYATLKKNLLFANHVLSLRGQLSSSEPGDCYLDLQLTTTRYLRASIEPQSGTITLSGMQSVLERLEGDRTPNNSAVEELLSRVARLRCFTAVEEIESGTKALGLESVNQRGLGLDVRKLFPPNTIRSAFFTQQTWDRRWIAAATSSMDGDHWWLVQLRPETRRAALPYAANDNASSFPLAHAVSSTLMGSRRRYDYAACAELVYGLTGILAIYANARCLADLGVRFQPPLEKLQLESDLQVSDLFIDYKPSILPPAFRIPRPSSNLQRDSFIEETIRLSFQGVDRQSNSAVLVAYGSLRRRIKSLHYLVSQLDPELLVQDNGGGFALRLLVPAGHSVIIGLFERLQRLDCVVYILQTLIQKGMEPRSLSLSQMTFLYGPDKNLRARFGIDVSGPSLSTYIDVPQALSQATPIFHLRLRLSFDSPSPHRRIQEPLTVALNHQFAEAGIEPILGLMANTFPLLRSLDQITSKPAQAESALVHVTVRSATVFQFHYPLLRYRFRLSACPRQGTTVWLLEDANRFPLPEPNQVSAVVREKVYNVKGNGWQGLGDGARSSVDHVGDLLSTLHECLGTCQPVPEPVQQGGNGNTNPAQPRPALQPAQENPAPPPAARPKTASPQKKNAVGNANIITID
ncbi:Mediator of RNA polymerase II transcription subunit 14 [Penicillium canariense]|uniref:Mediator of RNA polymerase II transcription subunit 14 n=1 Tax=Penicillium canariense TaxID=189055 RepID=A0A9W9HNP0_9EURO|nr:Mediator of RNA polymerase II transcription subunit 14 [Penicillium canariense]KAJ5150959.1 Mediator of RNA polymerase II transcription subunit 14 [Penicillium canariense]